MKLYTICEFCRSNINVKSSCSTRSELQMKEGDHLSVYCSSCNELNKKHVNDICAQANGKVLLIALIISIIVSAILWMILGAIGVISVAIIILFAQQEMKAVKSFNSYLIRRK